MRTTINLPPDLLRSAKRLAADSDRSLGAVIADALRVAFARREEARATAPAKLPTFKGTGVRRGVDLTSTARLLDVMEGFDESG